MTADHQAPTGLDFRNRVAGGFLRLFNPLARRMISAGIPTGAPNVLLTVRAAAKPIYPTRLNGVAE